MAEMLIPEAVRTAFARMDGAGRELYLVGGCVRDHLMGMMPHDFDMTTDALPEETKTVFKGFPVIETGIAHGTVTVLIGGEPLEITTYRVDGDYTDHRHPDGVTFTPCLGEDLARRDFTVNAMAYHPEKGVTDLFGGREDLTNRIIRCVGDPEKRFGEDALRILRALRFASVLDFSIEESTAAAVHALAPTLSHVSPERIYAELCKLLCGKNAVPVLREYRDVMGILLPELISTFGFDQHNRNHALDVWEHTLLVLSHTEPVLPLRLAALFHDAAKPQCGAYDRDDGDMHFTGHPALSAELAREALLRLRADNATVELVTRLVRHHDDRIPPERPAVRRLLRRFPYEELPLFLAIQYADAMGHNADFRERNIARVESIRTVAEQLRREQACLSLRELKINGRDAMAAGLRGKQVGDALQAVLEAVTDERIKNEREPELALLKRLAENTTN